MNAYELADEYEYTKKEHDAFMESPTDANRIAVLCKRDEFAQKLIRHQADRIAHLEMLLANRNEIIDKLDLTTPQIKELSDEEIIEIGNAVVNLIDSNEGWIEFDRAILKKASEK